MEISVNEDMIIEYLLPFSDSSGTIQKHLWSNCEDKNTYFKDKYPVTYSYKLNTYNILYVVISESKPFKISWKFDYNHVIKTLNKRSMVLTSKIDTFHVYYIYMC